MANATMHLLESISNVTAQACLAGVWQGCLLLLAVAVSLRLMPRVSASVRSVVWTVTFAMVVLLPLAEMHLRHTAHGVEGHAAVHADPRWAMAIAALWMVVTTIRLAELAWESARLWGTWRRATPLVDRAEEFGGLLPMAGRRMTLCRSAEVQAPCVIGFLAPRLLLPESLISEMTAPELRQVALHEWEHLRRGDDWINLAQRIAIAMFPLNPALPWMSRTMSLERELACDEGVVRATAAPIEYARCLTHLAERRLRARHSIATLALSAWQARPELVERVHRLLRPTRAMGRGQARVVTSLLCAGLMGGAAVMARTPQLISFVDTPATMVAAAQPAVHQGLMADRVEAVSFRPTSAAGAARMVPAVARMEESSGQHEVDVPSVRLRSHPRRNATYRVRRVEAVRATQQQGTVRRDLARAYELQTKFSPLYAAVPFEDGWLILQL